MLIDILEFKSDPLACPGLADYREFHDYIPDQIDKNKLIVYVVLLYSRDSILNTRPIPPLKDRARKAAFMADFNPDDQVFKDKVIELGSNKVRDLIISYLISQNSLLWQERCIVEAQIMENHRIRFKPIDKNDRKEEEEPEPEEGKKKRKKKKDPEDDLDKKDEIVASDKKALLTKHFQVYYDLLKKIDLEIFSDHLNVKDKIKKSKVSLESMAR